MHFSWVFSIYDLGSSVFVYTIGNLGMRAYCATRSGTAMSSKHTHGDVFNKRETLEADISVYVQD